MQPGIEPDIHNIDEVITDYAGYDQCQRRSPEHPAAAVDRIEHQQVDRHEDHGRAKVTLGDQQHQCQPDDDQSRQDGCQSILFQDQPVREKSREINDHQELERLGRLEIEPEHLQP